jgi:hypothetical protein
MLLSKAREMDIIGNTIPENMIEAEKIMTRSVRFDCAYRSA